MKYEINVLKILIAGAISLSGALLAQTTGEVDPKDWTVFVPSLILLGHKRLALQKGQHGSCRISQPVILSRMLAMEPALCLRSCPRAAPRPVVRRRLRSCQLEPPRSCRGGKKAPFGH